MPSDPAHASPAARRRGLLWVACGLTAWASATLLGPAAGDAERPSRAEARLAHFEGARLGGGETGSAAFEKRRGLLWIHAASDPAAGRAAAVVERLRPQTEGRNVALLVVAVGADEAAARALRREQGLADTPILVDPRGAVVRRLRLVPGRSALLAIDAEGYVVAGFTRLEAEHPDLDVAYERQIREALHLRKPGDLVAPELGLRPPAPAFRLEPLHRTAADGPGAIDRDALAGRVAVIVFFLPTCPHCHEALRFLAALDRELERDDLAIVPISVRPNPYSVEAMLAELGLDDPALGWTIYADPDGEAGRAWAHRHTVPDLAVIDRAGRVVARHRGHDARSEALLALQVRTALGLPTPVQLDAHGYSGEAFCEACHRDAHTTWALTRHAYAFETLVEHGVDRDPECLPCHVVGWGERGGYDASARPAHLEGVQCESCHGRGGPHQSPDFASEVGYERACATCHTPEHSLRFVFGEALPRVSHATNRAFAELSLAERAELIERRDRRERELFEDAEPVGSAACAGCHAAEHATWARGPHARASAAAGCESCHGPGGRHVAAGAPKAGTILGLTDKCDSCVILQICGSCHDEQRDPGFEFELDAKLDAIRHGYRDRPRPETQATRP